MPPPISYTISRRVTPIGTSIKPLLRIFPASVNVFVPLLFSVPIEAYHAEPFSRIGVMLAMVSTLLITVGFFQRPETAGNGGLGRGSPRPPSIEAISAVSSPQTNAPAPMRTSTSKLKFEPKILLPRIPISLAC